MFPRRRGLHELRLSNPCTMRGHCFGDGRILRAQSELRGIHRLPRAQTARQLAPLPSAVRGQRPRIFAVAVVIPAKATSSNSRIWGSRPKPCHYSSSAVTGSSAFVADDNRAGAAGAPIGSSPRVTNGKSVVQEASQLARATGMLELPQRLGLDLADALARHRELLADLFQRVIGVHADAEAHAQHALLAWRQ